MDFHDKTKQKMKKIKENKIFRLSNPFLIRFLSFDHGTDPQDKFVPNVVENEHFISFLH